MPVEINDYSFMNTLELYIKARELTEEGKRFALATVVNATGSTPQKAGANALFEAVGPVWGTLGGGCMEAESRRRALLSLDDGAPQLFDLKLDEVTGWDDGLICGGKVKILVQPNPEKLQDIFNRAISARDARQRGLIITVLQHPEQALGTVHWMAEEAIPENVLTREITLLHDALNKADAVTLQCEEGIALYVEPVTPPPSLIIAGAGHIGKALARQGALLGFEVTVIDDREAFANAENIPWATTHLCGDIADSLAEIRTDPQTYIVIVTRGHRHDGAALAACIRKPAAFIGMIGSKRKSLLIKRSLLEERLATREELHRVVSPVGLDIGAVSVDEIALSIAAQLVAVRRKQMLEAASMNIAP